MSATNKDDIKPEEIAPLLEEKVKQDAELLVDTAVLDAVPTGSKVQVAADIDIESAAGCTTGAGARVARKSLSFLGHRSTYYMIALIAQFCHLAVTTMGDDSSAPGDHNANNRNTPIADIIATLFTWFPFVIILSLTSIGRSGKKTAEPEKNRLLAGHHYVAARICAFINFYNFVDLLVKVVQSDHLLVFDDPMRAIVTPLAIASVLVAGIACMIAARITRLAATAARGTALVHDPNYLVPAWHLATAEESQICRRADREVQLPA